MTHTSPCLSLILQGSNTAVAVAVASRPRYVEKDSSNTEKEKEKEREKEKEESAVVMLLSDGCIEDITSMLFTTVVHNLSMIVGHNIDGLPLAPPPSTRLSSFSSSFFSTVRAALGLMGCQGEHYNISNPLSSPFYVNWLIASSHVMWYLFASYCTVSVDGWI